MIVFVYFLTCLGQIILLLPMIVNESVSTYLNVSISPTLCNMIHATIKVIKGLRQSVYY
jgi:hypothetical protein